MLRRFVFLTLALCALAACGNIKGQPLPVVDRDDPEWSLTPDHLEFGALPR